MDTCWRSVGGALIVSMLLASCTQDSIESAGPIGVSFSSPAAGALVSGVIEVRGRASGSVRLVEIGIDAGDYSPAEGTTEWRFSLDAAGLAAGAHRLQARATGNAGQTEIATLDIVVAEDGLSADLAGLVVSAGALAPAFDPSVTSYSAKVAAEVSSVTVTPTTKDAAASVSVQGVLVTSGTASNPILLGVGNNNIAVVVTAADGSSQKAYSIALTRMSSVSTNADLSDLVLSSATLAPPFEAANTAYSAEVDNSVGIVTATPTTADSGASVTVQGVVVASGTASGAINLAVGANTIAIVVTAADGTTQKTYSIVVIRAGQTVGTITASRSGGVAPLMVHFEAGYTNTEFRDNDFAWDFGDPSSGTWGTSGRPRNTAKGPIAAHVFEFAGTHTVTLTVTDGSGGTKVTTTQITVTDPNVVYAGTKTTCVNMSGDSDFTGAPVGSRQISTNSLPSITQFATAGSRILFKRGSSWSTTGLSWPETGGPVTIGAYGAGTSPDELGIYANAPQITLTSGSFLEMDEKQDYRIMDLTFVRSSQSGAAIGGTYCFQRNLLLRLKTTGFETGLGWTNWNMGSMKVLDQLALVSCDVGDAGSTSVYVGAERLVLLGNRIHDNSDSHVLRVWQAYKAVISHNILSGSSINNPGAGRHALKLHGPGYNEEDGATNLGTPVSGSGLLEHESEYIVISDNVFGSSGPWPVCLTPQNDVSDDNISYVIFERNRLIADHGTPNDFEVQDGMHVGARYVTIRNNVFDARTAASWYSGVRIGQRGSEPTPVGIEVYNNTFYVPVAYDGSSRGGVAVETTAQGTVVRNNLVYVSGLGGLVVDDEGTGTIQSNNQLNGIITFVDPANSNPLSRSFVLTAGSTSAIDLGFSVSSVFEDFSGAARPLGGGYDIGAFER